MVKLLSNPRHLLSIKRLRWVPVRGLVVAMLCFAPPALAVNPSHIHHLAKSERIDVLVIGHDELTREVQIDRRGRITLPLIGRVKARGRPWKNCKTTSPRRSGRRISRTRGDGRSAV